MKITQQQQNIIDSIKKYSNIKINAFAGSGKTSTLKLISTYYSNMKILYLAFNSAIKNEAIDKFPQNTYVKTTHGMAYGAIKKYTNIDLTSLVHYRPIDISKKFEISYNQAVVTLKIFDNFCNNANIEIKKNDLEHRIAKKMFDFMLVGQMKPTHSFYLKYYYLLLVQKQIPQYNYDIVMLDEAQDTNEVTLAIFEALNGKVKICVGDQHQQIYSFRGSKNALDKIKFDKSFYLSCSFRFNTTIASFANILLENFKNEQEPITVINNNDITNIKSYGYISRTNATLISIIATRIELQKPFVTIRDPYEIFNLTIEVYYFLTNQKQHIKQHYFLKDFMNEDELIEYIQEVDDFELKSAIKVAKEYGNKIFQFMDISKRFYNAWNNRINNGFDKRINEILFLTTAHTAKGLEWDSVTIADDFIDFADIIVDCGYNSLKAFQNDMYKHKINNDLIDEFNLFYVAITRAKKVLIKDSENFHYLLSNNIAKLINTRIKESKKDILIQSQIKTKKDIKISKLDQKLKQTVRQERNQQEGRLKNQGLKWSLEDKIKLKSLFRKNISIVDISINLQRTTSAILAELYKNETITKKEQNYLAKMIKKNIYNTNKKMLETIY